MKKILILGSTGMMGSMISRVLRDDLRFQILCTYRNINKVKSLKLKKSQTKKINISKSKIAVGGTLRRCPDIKKLKKLGYKPKVSIKNGLIPMINWYKKNLNLKKNV